MKKVSKNAKPTSSRGFISFSQVASSPPIDVAEEARSKQGEVLPIYLGAHPELLVISKKIAKKNEVTRMKSLQELMDVLQDLDATYLPDFLPFFVHVYHRLALDNKRAVREKLNICLTRLFAIDKRAFQPHMANLIGTLWMLRGDPYREVSEAARGAFEAAIPPKKRLDVVTHLSRPVFQFMSDKFSLSMEQMSDMSQCSVEEASERHERVTCSLLSSLSQLIHFISTSPSHLTSVAPHATLVINDKLWKKLTSKRPSVRKCTYELLSIITTDSCNLVSYCDSNRLTTIVFNALHNERDEFNIDALFIMIVSFMNSGVAVWSEEQWNKLLRGDFMQLFTTHPSALHHFLPLASTIPTPMLASSLPGVMNLLSRCSDNALYAAEALTFALIRCSKQDILPENILRPSLQQLALLLCTAMKAEDNVKSLAALLSQLQRYRLQIEGENVGLWDGELWKNIAASFPPVSNAILCVKESITCAYRECCVDSVCGVVSLLDTITERFVAMMTENALFASYRLNELTRSCDECLAEITLDKICQHLEHIRKSCIAAVNKNCNMWFAELMKNSEITHNDTNVSDLLSLTTAASVNDLWNMCHESQSLHGASLLLHHSNDLIHHASKDAIIWLREACAVACNDSGLNSNALPETVRFVVGCFHHNLLLQAPERPSISYHYAVLAFCAKGGAVSDVALSLAAAACDVNNAARDDAIELCTFDSVWSVYKQSEIVPTAAEIVEKWLANQLENRQCSAQEWAEVAYRLRLMTPGNEITITALMSSDYWRNLEVNLKCGNDLAYSALYYISHILFTLDAKCVTRQSNAFACFFAIKWYPELCLAVASVIVAVNEQHISYSHEVKDLRDLVHAILIADASSAQNFTVYLFDIVMQSGGNINVHALLWVLRAVLHCVDAEKVPVILETPLASDRCTGADMRYLSAVEGRYSLVPAICMAEHRQAGEAPYYSISIRDADSMRDIQTEANRLLLRWTEDREELAEMRTESSDKLIRALEDQLQCVKDFRSHQQEAYCEFVSAVLSSEFHSSLIAAFVEKCRDVIMSNIADALSLFPMRLLSALCSHDRGFGDGLWAVPIISQVPRLFSEGASQEALCEVLSAMAELLQRIRSRQLVLNIIGAMQRLGYETFIASDSMATLALKCIYHLQKFQKYSEIPFSLSMDGDLFSLQIAFTAFRRVIQNNSLSNVHIAIATVDAVLQKSDRNAALELFNMAPSLASYDILFDTMMTATQSAAVRVQCCKVLDIILGASIYTGGNLPVGYVGLDDAGLANEQMLHIVSNISTGGDLIMRFNDVLQTADWLQRENLAMVDDDRGSSDTLCAVLQWLLVLQTIDAVARQAHSCQSSLRAVLGSSYQRNPKWMEFMTYLLNILEKGPEVEVQISGAFSRLHADEEDFSTLTSDGSLILIAYTLFRTVCCLPAAVRVWWSDVLPRASKNYVAKFVESHVINSIVRREAQSVKAGQEKALWASDELEVRCNVASREVVSVYHRDEVSIEMVMSMPRQYPLKNIDIKCSNRMGIPESRWRRWTLQIIQLLSQQDGTILDALLLWKRNVDKEFEGVEPCPICYSILHPKTLNMPALTCPTCKNKFHSTCLYTWFKTSGKNKCVLCQQPFFLSG